MTTHIGIYEILDVIGDGGMGTVYRARDPRFDRIVAIKTLHAQLRRDPGVVSRFKSEAVIQAKLNHPYIVNTIDFIADDQSLAMVMEYVDGAPLSRMIETRGPLVAADSITIIKQVLAALGHAHKQGLVHRDMKPSNIVVLDLDGSYVAKVMDFGIAKILGEEKHKTATGSKMGTLAYMSPEQVKSPKNVDGRSDIYSIGVVLYEMLTGKVPFDADSEYEVMRQILEEPLAFSLADLAGVPKTLAIVVEKATAKLPDDRFAVCDDMSRALENPTEMQEWTPRPRPRSAAVRVSASASGVHPAVAPAPRVAPRGSWGLPVAAALLTLALMGGGALFYSQNVEAERRAEVASAEAAREKTRLQSEFERREAEARKQAEVERLAREQDDARALAERKIAEEMRQAEAERQVEAARVAETERLAAAEREAKLRAEEALRAEAGRAEAARAEAERVRIASLSVPSGTRLVVRPSRSLSSSSLKLNERVEAVLVEGLSAEGHVIVPSGARVLGEVVAVDSGSTGETPVLAVSFSRFVFPDGGQVSIATDRFETTGTKRPKVDRIGNALAGALLGGLLGGKSGAQRGALAGASANGEGGAAQPAMMSAGDVFEVRLRTSVRRP